jgi:hypothetical protein
LREQIVQRARERTGLSFVAFSFAGTRDEDQFRIVNFVTAKELTEPFPDELREAVVKLNALDLNFLHGRRTGAIGHGADPFDEKFRKNVARKMKAQIEVLPRGNLDEDKLRSPMKQGAMKNRDEQENGQGPVAQPAQAAATSTRFSFACWRR